MIIFVSGKYKKTKGDKMKSKFEIAKEHLMMGVSHMIPYVIMGGVFTAVYIIFNTMSIEFKNPVLKDITELGSELGKISFSLMIPILSGYIAYSIGGMVALSPAVVNGFFIDKLSLGLFGGIIVGFLSGYLARAINRLNISPQFKILMPIFIVPMLTVAIISIGMYYIVGIPLLNFLDLLENVLEALVSQNIELLIVILASMIAFDMGGPVNKIAYFFSVSSLAQGRLDIMGAVAVAICIPPISLGLNTYISNDRYSESEREVGKASIIMGIVGITEGAIPFAVMNPVKIVLSNIVGSILGASIALKGGVESLAPHGGLIVLPVVGNKGMYLLSIAFGVLGQILFLKIFEKIKNILKNRNQF
jgi:fructose-specific PTS system IIC-like component